MKNSVHLKLSSLVITLVVSSGCNKSEIKRVVEAAQEPEVTIPIDKTDEIVTAMQGSYTACVPSPVYAGYYNKVSVAVTNKDYTYTLELTDSSTCASYFWRHTVSYEIDKANYVSDSDQKNINLDLKMISFKLRWNSAGYLSSGFDCDIGGWVLNQDMDVTGLECGEVLSTYDAYHTAFKNIGAMEYLRIYLGTIPGQISSPSTTRLVLPIGYIQSGDSSEERKTLHTVSILKI